MHTYRLPTILQSCQHHRCKGVRIGGDCNLPSTKNHMRSLALSPSSKKIFWVKPFSEQCIEFFRNKILISGSICYFGKWWGKPLQSNLVEHVQKSLHRANGALAKTHRGGHEEKKTRTQSTSQNFFKKTVCWQHHLFFHIKKCSQKLGETWCFHCFLCPFLFWATHVSTTSLKLHATPRSFRSSCERRTEDVSHRMHVWYIFPTWIVDSYDKCR